MVHNIKVNIQHVHGINTRLLILFDIFINDLFYRVKESELHNFADDNTISSEEFIVEKLLKTLKREIQIASDWF